MYINPISSGVAYDWDEAKRAANFARHGVDFTAIAGFEWTTALIAADTRRDYGESRFIALGLIGDRVHVCVYTDRGRTRRIISLRKANRRETLRYMET